MRKLVIFSVVAMFGLVANAQQDISLFTLNNVFQQTYVNPAYLPKSKVSIGLPVISSVYLNAVSTGVTFGKFLSPNGNRAFDFDKAVDGLSKRNLASLDFNTDLFSLGIRIKNSYLSLSYSEVFNMNFAYSKDFFVLVFKGNADEELLGKRADMDGLALNMNLYHQVALGLSVPVGEKLRVGARAKYLMGLLNITTTKSQLGFTTNSEDFGLTLDGALALNTSGFGILKNNGDDTGQLIKDRLTKPGGNTGLALDLGLEYALSDRLTFSGSLLNMGYIHWAEDVKNFENDNLSATFEGFDLQELGADDFSKEMAKKLDTLQAHLKLNENTKAYSARLNPQLILAGNLALNDFNSVGTIVRSELIGKILRPSFSFYYQFKVNHWLGATVNYSYVNKSLLNLGGGLCVKLLPFQFFITSDNFFAPIALTTAKGVQLRAGINLAFGGREPRKLKVPVFEPEKE